MRCQQGEERTTYRPAGPAASAGRPAGTFVPARAAFNARPAHGNACKRGYFRCISGIAPTDSTQAKRRAERLQRSNYALQRRLRAIQRSEKFMRSGDASIRSPRARRSMRRDTDGWQDEWRGPRGRRALSSGAHTARARLRRRHRVPPPHCPSARVDNQRFGDKSGAVCAGATTGPGSVE